MSSDCLADEEEAPVPKETQTPTETSAPPAEATPGTTLATAPATTPVTTPATNSAAKAPVLAVTGAGSQPFLLMGALLMGRGDLLLLNRTLRGRKR